MNTKQVYAFFQLFLTFFVLTVTTVSCSQAEKKQSATNSADLALLPPQNENLRIATFAGGCFWCTEAVFERVKGVEQVISGYAGGPEKNPTYSQVSAGKTGHTESIQIYFDPNTISYPELLEIFFGTHDPTTLNRQGPDVGKQYRSAVFYHNNEQKQQTESYIQELEKIGKFRNPVVTEVVPFKAFYPAEGYHQDYYKLNPNDPYIISVAKPKIAKFIKNYPEKLKEEYRK